MIQSLIATIVELVSLIFALAAGAFLEERKSVPKGDPKADFKAGVCIILSLMLAACALGVAAR
jgi:hypothetical protein